MGNEPLVLAVDDDRGILRVIDLVLSADGFRVIGAEDGVEALRLAEQFRPDLVILDLRLPNMGGMEVMRRLRQLNRMPIIFLTAKASDRDKIVGLESGADDYLAKPFNPGELSARARAVLRRAYTASNLSPVLDIDGIQIDLDRRVVTRDDRVVKLTRTEWRVLQELAGHVGRVILNSELLRNVWGNDYRDELQYLRVWISRLRSKLERDPSNPELIITFPGIGYALVDKDERKKERAGQDARSREDSRSAAYGT